MTRRSHELDWSIEQSLQALEDEVGDVRRLLAQLGAPLLQKLDVAFDQPLDVDLEPALHREAAQADRSTRAGRGSREPVGLSPRANATVRLSTLSAAESTRPPSVCGSGVRAVGEVVLVDRGRDGLGIAGQAAYSAPM